MLFMELTSMRVAEVVYWYEGNWVGLSIGLGLAIFFFRLRFLPLQKGLWPYRFDHKQMALVKCLDEPVTFAIK